MGELESHVLLHPVRMRVVLVLGTDDLTTKQLQDRLPDVAQASLYRAVARLIEAEVITVVETRRRGGAMERVYRVAARGHHAPTASTPSDFAAAADTIARSLSIDAARHSAAGAATGAWNPESGILERERVLLTNAQFEEIRVAVLERLNALVAAEPAGDCQEYSVVVTAIPTGASAGAPH